MENLIHQALLQIHEWEKKIPNKADILTTLASLQALEDQHEEAFANYWKAHKLCRYYNRANWGLVLEKRHLRYTQMPDYSENNLRVTRELNKTPYPVTIEKYITNWNALSSEFQERVLYGSRIWFPYLEGMKQKGWSAYIKMASDLLSESPGMERTKDQRIGGNDYPNDNRLWDDVRGVGGQPVVADAIEVFNTVHGDYNLLGHEIAHQFQFYMDTLHKPGVQCIEKQYAMARESKNFPDAYSSLNMEEHFAQGVTYYLIPSDSPKRYGINKNWLDRNNLDQLSFIMSIEGSNGNIKQVRCP